MLLRLTITCCIFTCVSLAAAAQSTPVKLLEQARTKAQPEKVFFHFDKDYYLPGETIWFKAYLFSGIEISNNSTAIKVELISSDGRRVSEKLFPVFGATANGNIDLPVDLPPGNYLLRAFTRWMMNFGATRFYEKNIRIFRPAGSNSANDYSISFKPEGGNLVEELTNVVAFKAVDEWKRPVNVAGVIVNNEGDTVNSFSSFMDGMGKFRLFPRTGETYTAHCRVAGKQKIFKLPAAKRAVQLQVEENEKGKEFIIRNRSEQKPAYMIGAIENILVFETSLPATGASIKGSIPTDSFPSGILNIGVFDADHNLLATRSTFVQNNNFVISAGLVADTVSNKPYGKNVYTLSVADSLEGHFSVSVVEDDRTIPGEDNIITRMVLTDYSNFPIHAPQSYFSLAAGKQREAMDLLMLNYEFKHNNWQEIFKNPPVPIRLKDNNFISLAAKVTGDNNKKELLRNAQLNVLITTKDSSTSFYTAQTDKEGRLYLEGLVFEDTATIYFQNNSKKNRNKAVQIELSSEPVTHLFKAPVDLAPWKTSNPPMSFTQAEIKEYAANARSQQPDGHVLEEIKITSFKKSPAQLVEDRYATGVFRSQARKTLDFINDPPTEAGGNIFQYLKGKFSYLEVTGNYPDYSVQYRQTRSLRDGPIGMTLFLNEVLADAALIASIPLQDFAMIKIMSQGFVGAEGNGVGGVLAFYTKKFEDADIKRFYTNLNSIRLPGFSPVQTFVSPDYEAGSENFSSKDNRTTLYWNPALIINEENRRAKITFYNPNTVKRYKIIVQGMSADGKLLYIEKPVR